MEIIIKVNPKEIAALAAEMQERPVLDSSRLTESIIQHLQLQLSRAERAFLR